MKQRLDPVHRHEQPESGGESVGIADQMDQGLASNPVVQAQNQVSHLPTPLSLSSLIWGAFSVVSIAQRNDRVGAWGRRGWRAGSDSGDFCSYRLQIEGTVRTRGNESVPALCSLSAAATLGVLHFQR